MSELECFHSPVPDMDYIFFNMGVICWVLVGRGNGGGWREGDSVVVRKWSLQTVGCK